MFKQDLLVLIGGSILSLEMKGDLLGRDEPLSTPQFLSAPALATQLSPAPPASSHPAQAPNIASSRRLCCKNVSHHIAAAHSQSSDCETEPGGGGRGWRTGTALLSDFSKEELSTASALDGWARAADLQVPRTALNP